MKKLNQINFPKEKGTYILCLFLPFSKELKIGKLGNIFFKKGYYFYIGSAFGKGGFNSRLKRYLNIKRKDKWHIDYLLKIAEVKFFILFPFYRIECFLSNVLRKKLVPVKKFGSSDCKCISHLFYSERKKGIIPLFSIILHQFQSF